MGSFLRLVRFLVDDLNAVWQYCLKRVKQKILNKMGELLGITAEIWLSLALVAWYVYLLPASLDQFSDNVEIGCHHVMTHLRVVWILFSAYVKLFVTKFVRLWSANGWFRYLLWLTFLFLFCYLFIGVFLDKSASKAIEIASDYFVSRFEPNIIEVREDRVVPDFKQYRRTENGYRSFDQLFRFPMEDVEMNCTGFVLGPPGGRPCSNHIQWRKNGVPLVYMTDRYYHESYFTEVPSDDPRLNECYSTFIRKHKFLEDRYIPLIGVSVRDVGLTIYEIQTKLSILMLENHEFASYTCHVADYVCNPQVPSGKSQNGADQSTADKDKLNKNTEIQQSKKSKKKKGFKKDQKQHSKKKINPSDNQCRCEPERLYVFQDQHFLLGEFRLIKMEQQTKQLEAPPSSVLLFQTSYMSLSEEEDVYVEMDYTVNDVSIRDLCQTVSLNGCSELQLLWLLLVHRDLQKAWWFLFHLPGMGRNGRESIFGHCLCKNSFGRHNVMYFRQYYNRTTKAFEHFEITHPQTLLVAPPSQDDSNIFSQLFSPRPTRIVPPCDHLPDSAFDLRLLKDLAVTCATLLTMQDAVIIIAGVVLFICCFGAAIRMLLFVGRVSMRLCLEGSMAYLWTASKIARLLLHRGDGNELLAEGGDRYDLYLCHSEADREIVSTLVQPVLEDQLGLKVCVVDRDLPPNKPELEVTTRAIENSQRFVVFLSKALLQDDFRQLETSIIMETVFESASLSKEMVLVIRLDDCEVPRPLRGFTIHNWACANLVVDDHQRELIRWTANKVNEGGTLRSGLDAVMTLFLPAAALLAFVVFGNI